MPDKYWNEVGRQQDATGITTTTYEHTMPHGSLILVTTYYNNELHHTVTFVPYEVQMTSYGPMR